MSTVTLEAKSSSAIELERYPTTSQIAVDTGTQALEADERGSVHEAHQSAAHFEWQSAPPHWSVTENRAEAERASTLMGSVDEVLPQRNVSELAPTDEGFHAWAFVSYTTLPLSNTILRIPHPSLLLRFSSRASCGRSRLRTVPC